MKPNREPEHEESLGRVLRQWTLDTPLPPRFGKQVWQRITKAEIQPQLSLWAGLLRLVDVVLPRPKVAFAYVSTVLALGLAAGAMAAQIKAGHLESTLSARYVQSVSPYHAPASQP